MHQWQHHVIKEVEADGIMEETLEVAMTDKGGGSGELVKYAEHSFERLDNRRSHGRIGA